ncbi:aldolase [Fictibacillus nanhaiensis]|uniref:aldolase n=1 Tax=Fictibacillus nanhaiensis TaxID=742169 RepID=UPI002E244148|nr:aldolase [Fictibacillus nanhaiensis]
MNVSKKTYGYFAFGLQIESEYEIPEFTKRNGEEQAHVTIMKRDLSHLWKEHATSDTRVIVKENLVLFHIENLATFCVRNGEQILVSPENEAEEDRIRLYLLGSCMGALLMQRNVLCLHGSAIEINGKAYAITGHSGAGKSTLATAFLQKKFKLLTDDVIAITYDKQNQPMVVPGYPQQKLWKESLQNFGMEHKGYKPLVDRENKFAVPIPGFHHQPVPLAGLIELSISEDGSLTLKEITGLERVHIVMGQAFRRSFIEDSGRTEWQFKESMKLVNHVSIISLQRPSDHFTAHELVSLILYKISKKEEVTC